MRRWSWMDTPQCPAFLEGLKDICSRPAHRTRWLDGPPRAGQAFESEHARMLRPATPAAPRPALAGPRVDISVGSP